MTTAGALLAGPYGRELCSAIAKDAAPGDVWVRATDAEFLAALHAVRPEQVAALDEHWFLAELVSVVNAAVYWQEPDDDRERLARPEVVAALRPIADAVAAHPATAWWGESLDRSAQAHVRYWLRQWEAPLDPVDARPALRDWREQHLEAERRRAGNVDWRFTGGQWWSDPAFSGAAWTTPSRPGIGPLRLYCTEDSMGWDRARAHPVRVDERARVFEVAGPHDWARLVDAYPLEATHGKRGEWWWTTGRDGRWWIPDWPAVAEDYDAVHVTVTGYLSTAGWAIPTAHGATVLAGWGPGHTCWLRPDRLEPTDVVEQWHRVRSAEVDRASTWRRVPAEGPNGAVELRDLGGDGRDNDDSDANSDEPDNTDDDGNNDDTVALLTEATRLNVNWTGEERVSSAEVAADPALAHYTRLDSGRGDFGLVAEVAGRVVGIVWLLFLDSTDPGYGYIADGVPELSLCVWPDYRGVGIGALLIDAALAQARERGHRRVTLSVENGNLAKRLYRDKGFVDASGAAPGTMVIALRP